MRLASLFLVCHSLKRLVVVIVFGGCASQIIAAEPTTNQPPPFAKGTITVLDQTHKALSITTRTGPESFGWSERSYIFLGKQKLSPDKLLVGDRVAIRHYSGPDGERLILRMKVYREEKPQRSEPTPLQTQ